MIVFKDDKITIEKYNKHFYIIDNNNINNIKMLTAKG